MNEYELNSRLMEISLALDCDFLDLIYIKEQIKTRGLTPDSIRELKMIGFPGKIEDFEKSVFDFSEKIGFMSTHKANTFGYKIKNITKKLQQEELKRAMKN